MRIAVVGAGFVGLTLALRLAESGAEVSLFEALDTPGGLAGGFSYNGWEWRLERFYHHIFSNDSAIIRLSREVCCSPVFFRPKTAVLVGKTICPFDSPLDLLGFPYLPLSAKIRMGITLGFLKFSPFLRPLEQLTAQDFLRSTMGSLGSGTIWEPLLLGKFGPFASSVTAAWFWARIRKRTARLGYFPGGFQALTDCLCLAITKQGGRVFLKHPIHAIFPSKEGFIVRSASGDESFDRVGVTTSTPVFLDLVQGLPNWYQSKLKKLLYLDSLVVVMVLEKPFMKGIYWLNVLDRSLPFLVMVEHTNMIAPEHYGGSHLLYLGAYLPPKHRFFDYSLPSLRRLAVKQLQAIRKNFPQKQVLDCFVFRAPRAQPVVSVASASIRPEIKTPLPNLFLGNMDLVYPWDRGTNYAVELGERLADIMLKQ